MTAASTRPALSPVSVQSPARERFGKSESCEPIRAAVEPGSDST